MPAEPETVRTSELVDSLVQLSFVVQEVLVRVSAEHNLSMTQLRLLGILRDHTPPMSAIAEHLGLDRSSITGLVDRAERRGLVSRTASRHDARVTIVKATSAGLKLGRQLSAIITTEIEALVEDLPRTERTCIVRAAGSVLEAELGRRPPGGELEFPLRLLRE
jgi:MarR family transcriptional regulator, lower aerobic nicotinate degradation pathway regulator